MSHALQYSKVSFHAEDPKGIGLIRMIKINYLPGIFGLLITIIFVIIFYFIKVDDQWGQGPDNRLEDAIDGFIQIGNNYQLIISICLSIISIAFFNFAGISITKELSATTRYCCKTNSKTKVVRYKKIVLKKFDLLLTIEC